MLDQAIFRATLAATVGGGLVAGIFNTFSRIRASAGSEACRRRTLRRTWR